MSKRSCGAGCHVARNPLRYTQRSVMRSGAGRLCRDHARHREERHIDPGHGRPLQMSFRAARAACAVCLVIALLPLLGGCGEDRAVGSSAVDASRLGAPVPRDFLGLSFEMSSLAQVARYADGGDFATMLRSLGHGVLRFGGVSADTRVAWTDGATPLAPWASSAVQVSDLLKLRKLAADSGWRVLLTIGLAQYNPLAAAREALAARRALRGWLAGIELGNEPDAYARHHLRSSPWTFSRYGTQIAAYRRAIEKVAPGIAFVGHD